MALNNDYGFKTVNSDRQTAINGKWPIFGFDVNNINSSFKTTRIIDRSEHDFYNTGNTKPAYSYGNNTMNGFVKELITSYPHGYSIRPMGYYTVTGSFSCKCKAEVKQNASGSDASYYGGSYTRTATFYNSISGGRDSIIPKMNKFWPAGKNVSSTAYSLAVKISDNSGSNPNIQVPQNYVFPTLYQDDNAPCAYVSVEIDKQNVYIYMNYAYYDSWTRRIGSLVDMDSRVRMVADTSGSTFDVNVYLAPYSIKEFI